MKSYTVHSPYGLAPAMLCLLLAALPAFPAPQASQSKQAAPSEHDSSQKTSTQPGDGEKKFNQHCSRCHEAPQGFSPSIAGTVLRHMRTRASLSKQDEADILRFLNPE